MHVMVVVQIDSEDVLAIFGESEELGSSCVDSLVRLEENLSRLNVPGDDDRVLSSLSGGKD